MSNLTQNAVHRLTEVLGKDCVKENEMTHKHVYSKIGGPSDVMVFPKSTEEVSEVVKIARKHRQEITVIGNGSNALVKDGGLPGITINMKRMDNVMVKGDEIRAQSGADIIEVSNAALFNCLTGMEFACGIPGSVGGALTMNAGAYGGQVEDVILSAIAIDSDGVVRTIQKDDMGLGYRQSLFQDTDKIVTEVNYRLKKGSYRKIKEKIDENTMKREEKQPLEWPSLGSVFKRPEGNFAGKLIQDSELQGKGYGEAEVSKKHAGFIINKNNATASDYLRTVEMVEEEVERKNDIKLKREIKVIGREKSRE